MNVPVPVDAVLGTTRATVEPVRLPPAEVELLGAGGEEEEETAATLTEEEKELPVQQMSNHVSVGSAVADTRQDDDTEEGVFLNSAGDVHVTYVGLV